MNIIKLDATASTNTYLKELSTSCNLENFTVVIAEYQFQGRGQRGSVWEVKPGMNLTFSVLIRDFLQAADEVFDLNIVVALSVYSALKKMYNISFSIKWPNDILAVNKKIGGILIENILKAQGDVLSIVGIGLNVNQKEFGNNKQASSLSILLNKELDKEEIAMNILFELHLYCQRLKRGEKQQIWKEYFDALFRLDVASVFELPSGERFMGIIKGVSSFGQLQIQLEDDSIKEFGVKEVKLLY
ncbi:biotin--[acetyl-CoA-carboxylase] ligase [Myroides injenensis]|uniref:biotin--[acetyl-CoA-carboxylase] ligase n=1 Tax=Myroides injenensis TaxID=1183151 RepID=UPI0002880EF4|nr:biotin--[acetyl-CoA-carboxylase] ligase [Myroides injenensis]